MAGRVIVKLWEAPLAQLQGGATGAPNGLTEGEIGIASETGDLWKRPDGNPTGPLFPLASNPPAVTVTAGATTLTQQQSGLVIVSAAAGPVTINLPEASLGAADYKFFRIDVTSNTVEVVCYNTDTLYFNQNPALNSNGQQQISLPAGITELVGDGVSGYLVTAAQSELVSPLTVYVADPTTSTPPGNDSNNGLTPSTAFATIQRAWNYLSNEIVTNGMPMTIQVQPGTYAAGLSVLGTSGIPIVSIKGNNSNPSSTVVESTGADCFSFQSAAVARVSGFTVSSTTGNGIFAAGGAQVSFHDMRFGSCGQAHVQAGAGGNLGAEGGGNGGPGYYQIAGGALYHAAASFGGSVDVTGNGATVVNIIGEPAIGTFVDAGTNGNVTFSGVTFSGVPASGCVKYAATFNGSVLVNGSGTGYLPGSTAGFTSNGGTYG